MNMAIELICASCGHELSLDSKFAGKKVRCPGCQGVLKVPGGEPRAPAPARSGGKARAPQRAPRRRQEEPPTEAPVDEEERPRYQRRKKRSPMLPILLGCVIVVAIGYPLLNSQRSRSILQEVEADYEKARSKLAVDDGAQAVALMTRTVQKLEGLDSTDSGDVLFRHRLLYAEALIATMSSDKAMRQLEIAASHPGSGDQKVKLSFLRARAHPNQAEYEPVIGYYREALDGGGNVDQARQALGYAHTLIEAKTTDLISWIREIHAVEKDAESAVNETVRAASEASLPGKRRLLEERDSEFNRAYAVATELVESARRIDKGLAENYEAMFLQSRAAIEEVKNSR